MGPVMLIAWLQPNAVIKNKTETAFINCLISQNLFDILNMSIQDYRVDYSGVKKIWCLKTAVLIKLIINNLSSIKKTTVSNPDCERNELNDKEKDTLWWLLISSQWPWVAVWGRRPKRWADAGTHAPQSMREKKTQRANKYRGQTEKSKQ